jgi:hypothetical protein
MQEIRESQLIVSLFSVENLAVISCQTGWTCLKARREFAKIKIMIIVVWFQTPLCNNGLNKATKIGVRKRQNGSWADQGLLRPRNVNIAESKYGTKSGLSARCHTVSACLTRKGLSEWFFYLPPGRKIEALHWFCWTYCDFWEQCKCFIKQCLRKMESSFLYTILGEWVSTPAPSCERG